jgi:hypothetical protein
MKVSKSITKLLSNKVVLNVVFAVAFVNLLCLVVCGKERQVVLFVLIAFLTQFFSKNMIIVLGLPIVLVNLDLLNTNRFVEGMENEDNKLDGSGNDIDGSGNDIDGSGNSMKHLKAHQKQHQIMKKKNMMKSNNDSSTQSSSSESFSNGKKKNEIDYATTVEEAYENLGNMVGNEGMKKLGGDTKNLVEQQKALTETMKSLEPMVNNVQPLMNQMGGIIESLGGAEGMSKLVGMASAFTPNIKNKVKASKAKSANNAEGDSDSDSDSDN